MDRNDEKKPDSSGTKETAKELSIPEVSGSALSTVMHSGPGVLSPFMKEIYLTRQIIVGLRYQGGAKELLKDLKPGEKVSFLREPDNRFDRKAIMAVDEDGRKLGYIPRTQNDILASLMDAGKVIYGIVTDRQMVSRTGQTPGSIWVDLYMREFAIPGDLSEIPRHGYQGSYAVVDGELTLIHGETWVCSVAAVKVINGEERGFFERTASEDAEEDEYDELIAEFAHFVGNLPLVGHGISDKAQRCLEDMYGVVLGKSFSNHVIDTHEMAKNHLPWARGYGLESLADELGIEVLKGGSENEIRCRKIWQLYCRMERSELERRKIKPPRTSEETEPEA